MVLGMLLAVVATGGGDPVCREIGVLQKDGTLVQTLMCRTDEGRWRPAVGNAKVSTRSDGQRSSRAPAGFPTKAEVTFQGSYDFKTTKPLKMPSRLSLKSIMDTVQTDRSTGLQGTITLVAQIDGEALTGRGTGTGGIRAARLSGIVRNGRCHLMTDDETTVYDGQCGPAGFSGKITGGPRARNNVSGSFDFTVSQVVDIVQREQQRQVAAAQATKVREQEAAAERARIAALPPAGPVYTARLATQVQADSRGWACNHFDGGSVRNVKVSEGNIKSGKFVLRGEYTYNGGMPGWVLANYVDGKFDCIQFWDARIGCRALRTEADGQAMRGALMGAMTGGGGSRYDGPTEQDQANYDLQYDRRMQQQMESQQPR